MSEDPKGKFNKLIGGLRQKKQKLSLNIINFSVAPPQIDKGKNFTVTMNVQCIDSKEEPDATNNPIRLNENGCDVKPSVSATGNVTLVSGPPSVSVRILVGETKNFSWVYRADSEGSVSFKGNASGVDTFGDNISADECVSAPVSVVSPPKEEPKVATTEKIKVPKTAQWKKLITFDWVKQIKFDRIMAIVAICALILGCGIAFAVNSANASGKKNTLYIWAGVSGFQVKLDNKDVGRTTTNGLAIPIASGKHLVEVWSGDKQLAVNNIDINEPQEIAVCEEKVIKIIK